MKRSHTPPIPITFTSDEIQVVVDAVQVLLQDLSQKITVADLEKMVAMNEHKLQRIFRQCYGLTIMEYFTFKKIHIATRLLVETNSPVKVIASSIGYHSQNFSTLFKKYFNCTPKEYRQNAKRRINRTK